MLIVATAIVGCTSTVSPTVGPSRTAGTPPTAPTTPPTPSIAPTASPTALASHFAEALSYVDPDGDIFFFNDWASIKESVGAADLTSASSEDEKREAFVALASREYFVEGYGEQGSRRHAQIWNFDIFDYDWAVTIGEGPALHVIRFREGFDLAPVVALFDERGFTSERVGSGTLRTHDIVPADWVTDVAIYNVALLDDGRTILLSAAPDRLVEVLTTPRPPLPPHVISLSGALQGELVEPWAVTMVLDAATYCARIRTPPGGTAGAELLDRAGSLGQWDAMAVAYSRKSTPIGRIAFAYVDQPQAEAEVDGRRLLAEEGVSVTENVRYADELFKVENAAATDGVLQLAVEPVGDTPLGLFQPLFTGDMLYAVCSN